MTMADGAIQGPGSVDFEKHEAKIDDRDPLHTGVCGFHKLDCAGGQADRQFAATSVYDRVCVWSGSILHGAQAC